MAAACGLTEDVVQKEVGVLKWGTPTLTISYLRFSASLFFDRKLETNTRTIHLVSSLHGIVF